MGAWLLRKEKTRQRRLKGLLYYVSKDDKECDADERRETNRPYNQRDCRAVSRQRIALSKSSRYSALLRDLYLPIHFLLSTITVSRSVSLFVTSLLSLAFLLLFFFRVSLPHAPQRRLRALQGLEAALRGLGADCDRVTRALLPQRLDHGRHRRHVKVAHLKNKRKRACVV